MQKLALVIDVLEVPVLVLLADVLEVQHVVVLVVVLVRREVLVLELLADMLIDVLVLLVRVLVAWPHLRRLFQHQPSLVS